MDEYLHHVNKMENSTDEPKQMLAMGFNDDEDLFANNDIQLSMILDMNSQPKSVYLSYDEPKKVKKNWKKYVDKTKKIIFDKK